jgi:hypothetical protein
MTQIKTASYRAQMSPEWMGDFSGRDTLLAGGAMLDPATFMREDGTNVQLRAAAAQGAVQILVDALTNTVPANTLLRFAAGQYAYTTTVALAGADTIAVEALPVAIPDNALARYMGTGKVHIPSGTYVGRTYAQRAAGQPFHSIAFDGSGNVTDEETYLLAREILDAEADPECTLYRPGSLVYENFLPGWLTLPVGVRNHIRQRYETSIGAE